MHFTHHHCHTIHRSVSHNNIVVKVFWQQLTKQTRQLKILALLKALKFHVSRVCEFPDCHAPTFATFLFQILEVAHITDTCLPSLKVGASSALLKSRVRRCHACDGFPARRRRSRAPAAKSAASSDGSEARAGRRSSAAEWDAITNRLVASASIPFSILVLPQVIQNTSYMAAGNMAALSVISWEGYLSGLVGNTLLCSHFANSGESSAVTVQLVGIVNNMAVLLQVALASCMPMPIFLGVSLCVMLAVGMSLARLTGRISEGPAPGSEQWSLWKKWQLVSGVFGLAIVPQVLYNVLYPGAPNYLPGAVALVLLTLWFSIPSNRQPGKGPAIEKLPGWASTLLFALSPLPQLVRNFLDPGSLEGLSVGTMVLALLGNALMVPRALYIKDQLWQLGTCWACIAGWGQLLSMFIRESSTTGLRYVETPIFISISVCMLGYFAYVLTRNSEASELVR